MNASPPLDERVEQARERVEEQQAELRVAVQELQIAARRTFDLGHQVGAHPVLWTTGAFLLGFWMGGRNR